MMLVKVIHEDSDGIKTERVFPGITHYDVTHIHENSPVVTSGQDTPGIRLQLVDSNRMHNIKLPEDGQVVYVMDQSTGRTCQSYRINKYDNGIGTPSPKEFRTGSEG